ncbi:MAG: S-layer homology domain-containing protein [Muribaculaceae bacterium]|nr:S-layer homology domain-containing protein [Muribaculaceae bacterium]MCM1441806.1 S-layer homology domain-containing protein [Roseburia sp.]
MKNLKKVLALALAMVMMFGMMTVAFAADEDTVKTSDLVDFDEVTNKNEVALLVDLGVINGTEENGQTYYKPTNVVTRAEFAKMVYFIMQGNADPANYVGTANTKLSDIAGTWAEGYISFLAAPKIEVVAGDDAGKFNPKNTVTVAEAAKMLLVASGYNADDRGYVGSGWSGAVMNDARKHNLLDGIAQAAKDGLTRDNAAKMIVNALDVEIRTAVLKPIYVGNGTENYVDRYDEGNVTMGYNAFNAIKVTGIVAGLDDDGNIEFLDGILKASGKTVATDNVKIAGDASMIGQTVTLYVKGSAKYASGAITEVTSVSSVISSKAVVGGAKLLKTVTGGVDLTQNKWYDADDKNNFVVAKNETVYGTTNGSDLTKGVPSKNLVAGDVAEFYDTDGDGKADLIRVFAYENAKALSADPKVVTKGDKTTVTITGISGTTFVGYEGLKKGDVVLYYTNDGTTVLEKAEMVSGKVTMASSKGTITVGGKAYSKSEKADDSLKDITFSSWSDRENEFNFFLDKAGKICHLDQITESVTTKLAVLLQTGYVGGGSGIGGAAGYGQAELLFLDGTSEVVKVDKMDDKKVEAETYATAPVFVKYSEKNGTYTLTSVGEDYTAVELDKPATISAKIGFTEGQSANNKTVFIVGKQNADESWTYTVYTGYKAVPGLSVADGIILNDGATAAYVWVQASAFDGDVPDGYVYVLAEEGYNFDGTNNIYAAIDAEGKDVELTIAADVAPTVDGFYQIGAADADGVITKIDKVDANEGDVASGNGVFSVGESSWSYDDKTVCVVIDIDEEGAVSASTFSPDDVDVSAGETEGTYTTVAAYVIGDAGTTANYIYLVRTV